MTAMPTQLSTPLYGEPSAFPGLPAAAPGGSAGFSSGRGGGITLPRVRARLAPALSCRAAQRLVPPPALPSVRAWRRRRAPRSPASPPQPEGGREEAGRRAGAGEEAGLRRAVAGAERGGRAAGTRLAWLAASARTSAPQPRVSLALGFDSAAGDLEEPAGTLDHCIWSRTEKLLCLCSLGTLWKLHSDIIWELVRSVQPGA